jgi:DNA invertase Pin-like site-specific DNA recombinase
MSCQIRLPVADEVEATRKHPAIDRMQLMDAARQRLFGVVIVEALDRLSRDMEDLAGLHKRLSFQGIEIQAVHDGTADAILIGIRGLVGQMQREDGAKKVRRGMAGVVRAGRHAGGRVTAIALFSAIRGSWRLSRRKHQSFDASFPRTRLAGRRSARGCHPCLRYDLLPMCPGRTREYMVAGEGLEPPTPGL